MTIGTKLYRTQTTDDSMGWARSFLHEAPDGAVFLADSYTHARGRQGRTWEIMPGQLMVTLLLKPPLLKLMHTDDISIRLSQLNMAVALGILRPLKQYGASLKWPNDFIVQHKKIGGLLMQVVWEDAAPAGIIVGFALNVNNAFAPEHELFPIATSLKSATGAEHDLRALYKDLLAGLNLWYNQWQQMAFGDIYKTWKLEQAYLGQHITVHQKDGSTIAGIAQQVMPNGDLMMTIDGQKKQETVSFYQVDEVKIDK